MNVLWLIFLLVVHVFVGLEVAGGQIQISGAAQTNPLESWTQQTSGTVKNLNGIAYGNGLFLAVGQAGTILTSTNSSNWTVRSSGTVQNLNSIAYGSNIFVAVGAFGSVVSSPNGIIWTPRVSGVSFSLFGITYANNQFLAVGDAGIIVSSPNGINWTRRNSGTSQSLNGITYGNNRYVSVGDNGIFASSIDGITWISRTAVANQSLWAVSYGNNEFVVVGSNGTILTSTDANNWTSHASGTFNTLRAITFGNHLYVTGGDSGVILSSSDGLTWTKRTSGTGNTLTGLTYDNSKFVMVGLGGTILQSGQSTPITSPPPAVLRQPLSQTVAVGAEITLSVAATNALSYQWLFDGNPLMGQTNTTLQFRHVQADQAGQYKVVVSNLSGSITSQVAVLTVIGSLTVNITPWSASGLTANVGATIDLLAAPTGMPPWNFQWSKDGIDIIGATNSSYKLVNMQEADSGEYSVRVFNASGFGIATLALHVGGVVVQPEEYTFLTIAGAVEAGPGAIDALGKDSRFRGPSGIAVDRLGNLYIADSGNHTIRKIGSTGEVATLAGLAGKGGSEDGAGNTARFNQPCGMALDGFGYVYLADRMNHTIRKITPEGVVSTIAGLAGNKGSEDGNSSEARFFWPMSVAVDNAGNVYVADTYNHTIRKVSASGLVTTLAGLAGFKGSADGTGNEARFNEPYGVTVDNSGNVFVSDSVNNTIRKISPDRRVMTFAGLAGSFGMVDATGNAARFFGPGRMAIDGFGCIYVTDNSTIRKITPGGAVSTIAGSGGTWGYADGAGKLARFDGPNSVAVDAAGNIFVTESGNHTIRKVGADSAVTTIAGRPRGNIFSFDKEFWLYKPTGVTVDLLGNICVSDPGNNTIRQVGPGGVILLLAGTSGWGGSADGMGGSAEFSGPGGLATDSFGNILVADSNNHTIRKIGPGGAVTTVAGIPKTSGSVDGSNNVARFNRPGGVAVRGAIYVADTDNHTIRTIISGGNVMTLAGLARVSGSANGTGSVARFNSPQGLAVDNAGNILVADTGNHLIRKIESNGIVTTLAGQTGRAGTLDGFGGAAQFHRPSSLIVDRSGNVFVADAWNNLIRKITPGGVVTTLGGTALFSGSSDGTGSLAQFSNPCGISLDRAGNILIADTDFGTIRIASRACPDQPTTSVAACPVGVSCQFDTAPQTAIRWQWRMVRRPAGSQARLSAVNIRNPVFIPDVPDLYVFQLRATNALGAICIRNVELISLFPPVISAHPQSQTVTIGANVTLNVGVNGSAPFGFQWQFNNLILKGATNDSLVLSNVVVNQTGQYTVLVSNPAGTATSYPASLTINPGPLDQWTPRTSGTSKSLNSIDYGNGICVAVGQSGAVLSSTNGSNWTVRSSGTSQNLNSIAFGIDKFVAVGSFGAIVTSPDGIIWTPRVSGVSFSLFGITYANNQFVVVGDAGAIVTSADGIKWVRRTSGSNQSLNSVAYGSNRFIAVGDHSTVLMSLDGITWNPGFSGINNQSFWAVFYGNSKFVLVGSNGTILTSLDGINWISAVSGTYETLMGITYGNDQYITIGESGMILSSSDAMSWTKRTSGTTNTLMGIAFDNNKFSTIGDMGVILQSNPFVKAPPTIINQPQDQTATAGSRVIFSITVNSTTPLLGYQWQFNGSNLTGATNSTLVLDKVTVDQAGLYAVLVNNAGGSVVSQSASLRVSTVQVQPFRIEVAANKGIVQLVWPGLDNRIFEIQSSSNLKEWQSVASLMGVETNRLVWQTTTTNTVQFFRIRLQP